ncbi:MAG TPA: bifunctional precorrin-2 dehydrogenase/sirohydrochlorin ferrochelatase [Acidimicrobiales bacterium]|jgi:siroheme synthase-like protein|nr:bifunctional precorrin-2 dehydrogenase/sirohydrochlorin ferrochelatase [Acidimicrobiales bacterium]
MSHDSPLYPVALVVDGRRCLVVGGGPIATHKTEGLLRCRAHVTVVAPEITERLRLLADEGAPSPSDQSAESAESAASPSAGSGAGAASLVLEERPYRAGEAADYRLVITATGNPEVDRAVADDAEAAGVWVNSADDVDNCTFMLPAVHRDGDVTVAVSTGGASPALAGWLRDRAADAIGPEAGNLAVLLDEARRNVRAGGRSTEATDWSAILSGAFVDLVRSGQVDEARALLRAAVTEGSGRPSPSARSPRV